MMPAPRRSALLACLLVASLPACLRAAEPAVVAVIAVDGYADVKQQIGWVGQRVGNPQLAALAESFVMMATQLKGLAGLDPRRPAGIVVTAAGDEPVVHGYVPVKDLDRLLGVLEGMTGPVEQADGRRVANLPGGPTVEITERDGWAVVAVKGGPSAPAGAEKLVAELAEGYSVAAKLFPAAMSEGMREQLRAAARRGAEAAAARGQRLDLDPAFADLADTEAIVVGLAVDPSAGRMFLETLTTMREGSPAAQDWTRAAKAGNAPALPGGPAAIRGHCAQAVPAEVRPVVEAAVARALPANTGEPVSDALFGLIRDLVAAMLDSGDLDAGVVLDTDGVTPDVILPAVTLAARIGDGRALERKLKERFAAPDALPPEVKVAFDAGTAAGANLHEIEIDVSSQPGGEQLGGTLEATLAVSADRAYLFLGGDVARRLAATVAAGRAADPASEPLAGIDVSVPKLMAYAAAIAATAGDPTGQVLATVADEAAGKPSALVQLLVKPIERGVSLRLSADAGAIETIAAAVTRQITPVPAPPGGLAPGPPPVPLRVPAPAS